MTKQQFRKKVRELHRSNKELLESRIDRILVSGCINLKDYEDNYLLPKYFMSAFGMEIEWQFRPLTKNGKKMAKNIALFM